jgi:hypothetical protein
MSGYILTVSGSDGTYSDAGMYTIDITNVNDNAPTVEDGSGTIAEDAAT